MAEGRDQRFSTVLGDVPALSKNFPLPVPRIEVAPERTSWLVVDPNDISVCLQHPRFAEDLIVSSTTRALYRVYMGRTTLQLAIATGEVAIDGVPSLVRAFAKCMAWSNFAPTMRSRLGSAAS